MKLNNYVGFSCDACGNVWEREFRKTSSFVQCPECLVPVEGAPEMQIVVADTEISDGVFECYACGHTFEYAPTINENPDETPNCTHCTSSDVGRIW